LLVVAVVVVPLLVTLMQAVVAVQVVSEPQHLFQSAHRLQ
jgi:hypothetical protein